MLLAREYIMCRPPPPSDLFRCSRFCLKAALLFQVLAGSDSRRKIDSVCKPTPLTTSVDELNSFAFRLLLSASLPPSPPSNSRLSPAPKASRTVIKAERQLPKLWASPAVLQKDKDRSIRRQPTLYKTTFPAAKTSNTGTFITPMYDPKS